MRRRSTVIAAAVLLLVVPCPTHVLGHSGRTPLGLWGKFPADVARCQRVIGEAATFYASQALTARALCRARELVGTPCDLDATDATVRAARGHALDQVDAQCNDQGSGMLGFLGVIEVQADLTSSCEQLEASVAAAVFAPVPALESTAPLTPTAQRCVLVTAGIAPKLMRFALRAWAEALDRIAVRNYSPNRKQALVDAAQRRITSTATRLSEAIGRECTPAEFLATYHQDATSFLTNLSAQVDCVVGGVYAQAAVVCPPAGP